jgi:thiamine biosynthesis lipoprotein ApbE
VAGVAGSGLDAELLTTALYVLGPDQGLGLAQELDAAAAFLLHDGSTVFSPAFRSLGAYRP